MIPINAKEAVAQVRQILNDAGATGWTEAQIVVNLQMAERRVKQDRASAAYTSPVAFNEGVTLAPSGNEGALGSSDTIEVDVFYQNAIVHYAAFLCFISPSDRSTVNKEFSDRELAYYKESI